MKRALTLGFLGVVLLMSGLAVAALESLGIFLIAVLADVLYEPLPATRVILAGGLVLFCLGLIDDFKKPHGLGFKTKFVIQFLVAFFVALADVKINFINPSYLSFILTMLWIVGVSNAFNIIDIHVFSATTLVIPRKSRVNPQRSGIEISLIRGIIRNFPKSIDTDGKRRFGLMLNIFSSAEDNE